MILRITGYAYIIHEMTAFEIEGLVDIPRLLHSAFLPCKPQAHIELRV